MPFPGLTVDPLVPGVLLWVGLLEGGVVAGGRDSNPVDGQADPQHVGAEQLGPVLLRDVEPGPPGIMAGLEPHRLSHGKSKPL